MIKLHFRSPTEVINSPCAVFPQHVSASDLDCLSSHATTCKGSGRSHLSIIYFLLHYVYKGNTGYVLTLAR